MIINELQFFQGIPGPHAREFNSLKNKPLPISTKMGSDEEKIGKSYDIYKNKRLKNGHVGNTYDVDENTGSYALHPTMLMKNRPVTSESSFHVGAGH